MADNRYITSNIGRGQLRQLRRIPANSRGGRIRSRRGNYFARCCNADSATDFAAFELFWPDRTFESLRSYRGARPTVCSLIHLLAVRPARALRNLCQHAAIHLNVEWRDPTDEQWAHQVRTAQGRTVPVSQTPRGCVHVRYGCTQ
jgi:hypothetical protein